jgi:hypothetical protein
MKEKKISSREQEVLLLYFFSIAVSPNASRVSEALSDNDWYFYSTASPKFLPALNLGTFFTGICNSFPA